MLIYIHVRSNIAVCVKQTRHHDDVKHTTCKAQSRPKHQLEHALNNSRP